MANLFGTFGTGTINVIGGGTTTPTTTTTTTSAGTTSQDRINIGFGPRLGQAPTSTGGFQFTGQTAITPDDYLSRRVDFTKEFIGLPSLAKTTGIATTTTEVGEDIELGKKKESDDDDTQSVLGMGTAISGETAFDAMKVGLKNVDTTDYNKYSDYLTASGKADRVGMVRSIYEPLFGGDISDVNLGEFVTTAQEAPAKAGKAASEYLQDPSKIAKKGMAAVVSAAMPFPAGPVIGGIIGGQEVKNAFGNTSLRPSGMFGLVHDAVLSRQYQDMSLIRAAQSAANMESSIPGLAGSPTDTGFALQFKGGFGVTRRPGATGYTGNTNGLSHQQLKNMEAVSKGYLPQSYTFDTTQKKGIFGQNTNVTIEESGGAMAGTRSFYTATGGFYDGRTGQTSAMGRMSDLEAFARTNSAKYGISEEAAKQVIFDARAGKGKVADLLKDARAAASKQRAEQRKAEQARIAEETRIAEEARQAEAQRIRGQVSLARDDVFYGGDDEEGPSFSSSGPSRESAFDNVSDFEGLDPDDYAAGGVVGMAAGGAMAAGSSGFIGAPPSQVPEEKTVADDQLTEYPEGTFVINAAAVEEAGESDIIKMLNDAEKEAVRRGITLDNSGNSAKLIDVAVSQGEVKVAPYLAKVIGYDRLRKINNRGKPEVAERQQEAAQGGMLGLKDGGTVTGPARRPKLEQLADIELRADLEPFIQGDSLARLGYMLYEKGDMRFKALPLNEGSRAGMLGQYFPANDERTDVDGVQNMRPFADSAVAKHARRKGIPASELDSRVANTYVLTGLLESTKRDDGSSLYDSAKKPINLTTIAHELRHAAMDYLSKRYDFTLPDIRTEERIMDYADGLAIENASKVNPEVARQYAKQKNMDHNRSRIESARTIPKYEKAYTALTQMADKTLEEEGYPKQTPAVEQEGFLTRGIKSLFN